MRERGFSWTGAALVLLGLFLVLRTVRQDGGHKTLVDHILGDGATPPPAQYQGQVTRLTPRQQALRDQPKGLRYPLRPGALRRPAGAQGPVR